MGRIVFRVRQVRMDLQQRLGRNVTIKEVAEACGISRVALTNIENGRQTPGSEVLARLCSYYGVGVGDLLVYEEVNAAA